MESIRIQISLIAGLLKLQADGWQSKIGYGFRFILCGIFTYLSFVILKPLGDILAGKENEIIAFMFDNPPFTLMVLLTVIIGYFGLYLSIIAAALFASLLPKA